MKSVIDHVPYFIAILGFLALDIWRGFEIRRLQRSLEEARSEAMELLIHVSEVATDPHRILSHNDAVNFLIWLGDRVRQDRERVSPTQNVCIGCSTPPHECSTVHPCCGLCTHGEDDED